MIKKNLAKKKRRATKSPAFFLEPSIFSYYYFYKGDSSWESNKRKANIDSIIAFWENIRGGVAQLKEIDALFRGTDEWIKHDVFKSASGKQGALLSFHDCAVIILAFSPLKGRRYKRPAAVWKGFLSKLPNLAIEPLATCTVLQCMCSDAQIPGLIEEGKQVFSNCHETRGTKLSCGDLIQYSEGERWVGKFVFRVNGKGADEKSANIFLTTLFADMFLAVRKVEIQYRENAGSYLNLQHERNHRVDCLKKAKLEGSPEDTRRFYNYVEQDAQVIKKMLNKAIKPNIKILTNDLYLKLPRFHIGIESDEIFSGYLNSFASHTERVAKELDDLREILGKPQGPSEWWLVNRINEWKIRRRVQNMIKKYEENKEPIWNYDRCPEMADHGFRHTKNVFKLIENILRENKEVLKSFWDEELFFLIISVWLHDIGMKGPKDKSSKEDIRLRHSIYTADRFVWDDHTLFGLETPEERAIVGEICIYHSSRTALTPSQLKALGKRCIYPRVISQSQKFSCKGGSPKDIRMPLLAALLSMGDASDVQQSRIGSLENLRAKIQENEREVKDLEDKIANLPKDDPKIVDLVKKRDYFRNQVDHYKKHYSVSKVWIKGISVILKRYPGAPEADFFKAQKQVQEELKRSGPVLKEYGIYIDKVREP